MRTIYQCENCKGYMDYDGTRVEVKATQFGSDQNFVRWCDDCLAKVKQRAVVEMPKPVDRERKEP